MPTQTSLNYSFSSASNRFPGVGVGREVGRLVYDILTLLELQCRLLAIDLKQGATRSVSAIGMICLAVALLIGAMSVGLAAIGIGLMVVFQWPLWGALLAAAGIGIFAFGIIFYIAVQLLNGALGVLKRSRDEFIRNMQTMKNSLAGEDESFVH